MDHHIIHTKILPACLSYRASKITNPYKYVKEGQLVKHSTAKAMETNNWIIYYLHPTLVS